MKKIQKIIQKMIPKRSTNDVPSTPEKVTAKTVIPRVDSHLALKNSQQPGFSVADFQIIYCTRKEHTDTTKIVLEQKNLSHFYAIFEDLYIQRLLQVDCCYLVSDVNNLVLSFIYLLRANVRPENYRKLYLL